MTRTTTSSTRRRLGLPCLALVVATTPTSFLFALAFKSNSIKQPYISSGSGGSFGSSGNGVSTSHQASYRRRSPTTTTTTANSRTSASSSSSPLSSSRSPVSITHHRDSSCIILHAAEGGAGANDDNDATRISLDDVIDDNVVQRRLFAAAPSTERTEILIFNNNDADELNVSTTTTTTANSASASATTTKAATSTVNERLLSEIQASLDKQKGSPSSSSASNNNSKTKEYFKEFRSTKTEEERQRSLEEARDLNGVNPLVCIGGAAFAWACAGALWVLTTYLGVFFASHPLDSDVYFVQRVAGVFRNVVVGLSSLASGFFGVVGVGIFLLGVRVGYGVIIGELDPTPIKVPKMKDGGEEDFVLPDVWELMMGKKKRRR